MNAEWSWFPVVPVGGGLPVTMHSSVATEPLDAAVSTIGLLNFGPTAASSSADGEESSDRTPETDHPKVNSKHKNDQSESG